MNIYFSKSDRNACAYYRMELPHRFLIRQRLATGTLGFIVDPLLSTHMEDICVIQRQYSPGVFPLITKKRSLGIKIVGELDDNLWAITPDNPNYPILHSGSILERERADHASGALSPDKRYLQPLPVLADFYRYCDAVTVPTEPLASVLRKYNPATHVLKNWVDDSVLSSFPPPMGPGKTLRILWAGSDSHRDELVPAFSAIRRLMREDPRIVFCYVGAPHPFLSQMPKDRLDVYPPTQFVPQYYWLMSKIPAQIAIAPLNDSAFNQGKSQLKALEYGAFGYFPVLQSLPPYLALKDLGMEHLPAWVPKNTEEQWYRVLRDATQDPGECLRRAVEYQQAVLSQCRYSQHIKEWLECYEKVLSSPPNHLPVPRNYGH